MAYNADTATGQLPLKDVVLCCTSLTTDVRTKIADTASQMGAVHKLDLTSDVTHLIVGSITTPKYRYVAKDRPDIKVLHPEWIDAVREAWMEGGDVDVVELEQKHTLRPFYGLQICVTGFEDLDQRNYLSDTIGEQGATYHGDLTKAVTHLIAAAPRGAKYVAAKQWGLQVVSLRWFEDSLRRGMALDESLYDPAVPASEQGKNAFTTTFEPRTSIGKRAREELQESARGAGPKKRLRRTASTRLGSQSQDMWQDISARDTTVSRTETGQWEVAGSAAGATELSQAETSETEARPQGGIQGVSDKGHHLDGLFSGCYVLIHGFDTKRAALLERYLEPNGAKTVQSSKDLEDASLDPFFKHRCLVVPHTTSDTSLSLPDIPPGTIIVTEWWVERCLHSRVLLMPSDDLLSRPLGNVRTTGFSGLQVSSTGFFGADLLHISAAINLMGGVYEERFLPSASVLISATASVKKEKAYYAKKHNIPIVSADWLWTALRTRKTPPFLEFALPQSALATKDSAEDASRGSRSPQDRSVRMSGERRKTKDDHQPIRLSNTRRRHATPSLPLARPASASYAPQRGPFIEDDDADGGTNSPSLESDFISAPSIVPQESFARPQPLKEVSPNLSPRKSKSDDRQDQMRRSFGSKMAVSRSASPQKPVSPPRASHSPRKSTLNPEPPAPVRAHEQLTADLASILNRQVNSRPSSATSAEPPAKRRNRPLGRAASGISTRSLSASAHSDIASPALPFAASDAVSTIHPPPQSTQIGYELAETEAHRIQMSKKMGTSLDDKSSGRRVASLGTVKDSMLNAEGAVGDRVRARHRK